MQSFPADFGLTFQTGKIIVRKLLKPRILTRNQQALDGLSQQELMVKGDKSALVFKPEYNPDSHGL